MRATVRTIAILIGLLLAVPAFAGSLAELLKSPAYMDQLIEVTYLGGGKDTRFGKLIEVGDDYLELEISGNYFDKFDPPSRAPSPPAAIYNIIVPFSAILYVRLEGK